MLTSIELAAGCNEASDLLPVRSPDLLAAYDADRAFWTVLDEGPVENCLALLVCGRDGGWRAHHVRFDAGSEAGRTEDGEALSHVDGWVYVIGSHFGSKAGPLRPRRAFFARFREDAAASANPVPIQVVRNQFRLHRALNDALRGDVLPVGDAQPPGDAVPSDVVPLPGDAVPSDVVPLPGDAVPSDVVPLPGDAVPSGAVIGGSMVGLGAENRVHDRFITATWHRGTGRAKSWVSRLAAGDWPCNVEAAVFTPAGTLLLGLRFPVSVAGEPILVEIDDVAGMFDADRRTWPAVVNTYVLAGVTPPGTLTGFRALSAGADGWYHAVIGSIDATGKGSVLLDEHPAGGDVHCRHVRFRLPEPPGSVAAGEMVADLTPFHNVEGLAVVDGVRYYVTDEDHQIALWLSFSR